jgi:Arc/MetJ-type ribon-helix-helix transcriptional regulator
MNVQLKPEQARFIEEQVRAGRFESAEVAVEAAITQMMFDPDLDEETIAAIEQSEREIEEGKCIPWEIAEAEFRRRFLSK